MNESDKREVEWFHYKKEKLISTVKSQNNGCFGEEKEEWLGGSMRVAPEVLVVFFFFFFFI